MVDDIYEYESPTGTVFEVFRPENGSGEIGFFVARRDDVVSFFLPEDEAWNLLGNLTEALK